MKFDHIGVFVKTLDQGRSHMEAIFPIGTYGSIFHDPLLKVSVQFLYDKCGVCYEIIAPNGDGNPVETALKEKRNLLNHVAYKVKDFDFQVDRLRQGRCIPLGFSQPALAFGGSRVIFFLTPLRIIIEIIEDNR